MIGRCGQEGSPGTGLAAGPARREGKLGEAGGCLLAVWLAWPLEGCWQLLAACSSHLMLLVRPACFSTASLALLGPQSTSLSSKAPLSPPSPLTTVLNLVFDHPVFAVELPSLSPFTLQILRPLTASLFLTRSRLHPLENSDWGA